jgi:hypothetical protein
MQIIGQLVGALFKTFFKTIFFAIVGAAVGGGATLLVSSYEKTNQLSIQWPPQGLTLIAAIAVAVLSGYAVGLTVLAGAAIRGLITAGEDVVKEATTVGNLTEDVVKHF